MSINANQEHREPSDCVPLREVIQGVIASLQQKSEHNNQPGITNSQITTIFSLAKQRGLSQKDVLVIAQKIYNKPLSELTLFEASDVIQTLIEEVKNHA